MVSPDKTAVSCQKSDYTKFSTRPHHTSPQVPIAGVAKTHGVSGRTIHTWRKRFGATDANAVKRLRLLEQANARLRTIRLKCRSGTQPEAFLQESMVRRIRAGQWEGRER